MKPLPQGNYALAIAHPGHELRLHGFLDNTKPWLFILCDEGDPSHMDRMQHYLGSIYKNTGKMLKQERDVFYVVERKMPEFNEDGKPLYVKDSEIQSEIMQGNTAWFEFYVKKMANSLIKDNIDFMVVDSSEEMDAVHEINRMMAEIAIKLVKKKKGKQIQLLEFNVLNAFNHNLSDDCIQIELSEEQQHEKIKQILGYHEDVFTELSQNISISTDIIKNYMGVPGGFEEIKKLIRDINPEFFKYEYIFPVREQTHGEDYNKIILPLKEKLEERILNPVMVKINS